MIEEVETAPTFVTVDHGCVQHAVSGWREDLCTQCHSSLAVVNHDRPNAVASGCEHSIALGLRRAAKVSKRGPDQQEDDPDGDVVIRDGSEKQWNIEKSGPKLFSFTLETENVPNDEYSMN